MKTILKTVIVTACVSTAMFLASCGSETKKENNHEHSGSDNHDEHIYTCSMHPDEGIIVPNSWVLSVKSPTSIFFV